MNTFNLKALAEQFHLREQQPFGEIEIAENFNENTPPWLTQVTLKKQNYFIFGEKETIQNTLNSFKPDEEGYTYAYDVGRLNFLEGAMVLDTSKLLKALDTSVDLTKEDISKYAHNNGILSADLFNIPIVCNIRKGQKEKFKPCDHPPSSPSIEEVIVCRGKGICAWPVLDINNQSIVYYLPSGAVSRNERNTKTYPHTLFVRERMKALKEDGCSETIDIDSIGVFLIPLILPDSSLVYYNILNHKSYSAPIFRFKNGHEVGKTMNVNTILQTWLSKVKDLSGSSVPVGIHDDLLLPIEKWLTLNCFNAEIVK